MTTLSDAIDRIRSEYEKSRKHVLPKNIVEPSFEVSITERKDRFVPSLNILAEIAGEEWGMIHNSPQLLKSFSEMVRINRMVSASVIPASFIHRVHCLKCGDVPIDYDAGRKVEACPWCVAGSVPRFLDSVN